MIITMKKKLRLRNYSNISMILMMVGRVIRVMIRVIIIIQDRILTMYKLPLCRDPIRWSDSLDVTVH